MGGPAADIEVSITIDHLLGRARSGHHIGDGDRTSDGVALGVDDGQVVAPELRYIGLLVRNEADVARSVDARNAASLTHRVEVEGKDDVRIGHRHPTHIVAAGHRLRLVTQAVAVEAIEEFVVTLAALGVVEREGTVSCAVVAGVDHYQRLIGDDGRHRRGVAARRAAHTAHHREQCRQSEGHLCCYFHCRKIDLSLKKNRRSPASEYGG